MLAMEEASVSPACSLRRRSFTIIANYVVEMSMKRLIIELDKHDSVADEGQSILCFLCLSDLGLALLSDGRCTHEMYLRTTS